MRKIGVLVVGIIVLGFLVGFVSSFSQGGVIDFEDFEIKTIEDHKSQLKQGPDLTLEDINVILSKEEQELTTVSLQQKVINSFKKLFRIEVTGIKTDSLNSTLKKRKELLLELIEKDPTKALSIPEIPSQIIFSLTKEEKNNLIEKRGIKSGALEVIAIDDFENPENSKNVYNLYSEGIRYELFSSEELPVVSGMEISVGGISIENKIAIDQEEFSIQNTPKTLETLGEQRTIVIIGYPSSNLPESNPW